MSAGDSGRRLSDVLLTWLPQALGQPVARSRVRALVTAGAVRVNGLAVRGPGRPVRAGQLLEALVRPAALAPPAGATDRPFQLTPETIVYQDEALVGVSKPPGLPLHATADPGRPSLVAHVRSWLAAAGREPYVAVHQRLDRDTSGIVLFAIDRAANAGLARAFADREVVKTYLALTARPDPLPAEPIHLVAPLGVAGRRVAVGGSSAREAVTDVVVRELLERALLVEARPRTGRKHQVRVQLAHAGLPILGDDAYGVPAAAAGVPRLMLHASRLELAHPLTGRPLVLASPLPGDFKKALDRARRRARAGTRG